MGIARSNKWLAVATLGAGALVGCSAPMAAPGASANGNGLTEDTAAQAVSSVQGSLGGSLGATAFIQARDLTGAVGAVAQSLGTLQPADQVWKTCLTQTTSSADADRDGLAADTTVSLDCSFTNPDTGVVSTAAGSVRLMDKNDRDPGSGFVFEVIDLDVAVSGSTGTFGSLNAQLDLRLDYAPRLGGFDLMVTADVVGSKSGESLSVSHDLSLSYRGDDATDPFVAGQLTASGSFSSTLGSSSAELSFATPSPGLRYSRACPSLIGAGAFDDGTLELRDDRRNEVTVDFDGCGTGTYTLNDAAPVRFPASGN